MSLNVKKNRHAFRPTLSESVSILEERLVMAATVLVTPAPAPPPTHGFQGFELQQIRSGYSQQFKAATNALRSVINAQTQQLFANGTPTQQQLDNFNAYVAGAINATSFRLSSQSALLPSSERLLQNLQNSLLSNTSTSLVSRLDSLTTNARAMSSIQSFNSAVNNQFNRTMVSNFRQLGNFFNTTPINRLAVDQSGNRVPLQQYFGNRVLNQFGNTLGALANSFGRVANSSLFSSNGTGIPSTPTPAAVASFQAQFAQSLGVAAGQLGNSLSIFGGTNSSIGSQIQSALYGTATAPTGGLLYLYQQIRGLDPSNPNFNTTIQNQFDTTFHGLQGTLTDFFHSTPSGNQPLSLPTGQFNLPFAGQNFFNSTPGTNGSNVGFNNGFGSGFMGFGQAPSSFNSNFSTGFNSSVNNTNYGYGLQQPTFSLSNGSNGMAIG